MRTPIEVEASAIQSSITMDLTNKYGLNEPSLLVAKNDKPETIWPDCSDEYDQI